MTLYEIDARLESLVDPETGELLDMEAFSALQMEREAKIENVALWYKNLQSDAAALDAEIKALTERRKSAQSKAERLKGYLEAALDGEKFETARCAVSFRATPAAVHLDDPEAFAAWCQDAGQYDYLRYKPPEVNKTAVKEALKAGVELPGAWLEQGRSCTIK